MKILVAGEPARAKQWEKYLREINSVQKVILSQTVSEESVDAVILLSDKPDNLDQLIRILQKGYPVYLVSKLPLDLKKLQQIYNISEEANVSVQFSHWPSLSAMTHWVRKRINNNPRLIQIHKYFRGRQIPDDDWVTHQWTEEIAYIFSLKNSTVQNISSFPIKLNRHLTGIQVMIRFDNASVASLHFLAVGDKDQHERIIYSKNSIIQCDLRSQKTACHTPEENSNILKAEHGSFDPADTAPQSVEYFIRSVKTYRESGFSASKALQTARSVKKIKKLISKI